MTEPPSPLTMLFSRHTRRREFITLLGGAAVVWPVAARAQQPNYADDRIFAQFVARWCRTLVAAFRQGLNITGFVEVKR